jgi:hypothetical protein
MADATVTLGLAWEGQAGLRKATADVDNFSKQVQRGPLGKGGGGGRAAGISMQLQDIAVQAQMGTSALTIFSQQAPQLLSVFGNFGALAGGFAAVGGAAFTFGQKSSEAFRTALNDAAALNSEIARLAGSGATLESSLDAFTKIRDAQKAMASQSQSRQDGGGFGQMSQELLSLFGLAESNYDQTKESEVATIALKKQQARLQNEIVKASGNEVMLAKLKASGDEKAVQALEQKLKLEAQIQKIKSFGLDAGAEAKLIENATTIAGLQEKQKASTYDVAKNLQEQANAVKSVLTPYRQLLDYLEQEKKKLDDIKAKKEADKKASQIKNQGQKEAAQTLQDEIRLLEVRAGGNEESIKAAERELALKQKAREIQTQLQTDAKTALDIAKQMQALEDKAQKAKDRPEGRIQGYSSGRQGGAGAARGRAAQRAADSAAKRAGAYSRGFGGLAEFNANQIDPNFARPMTPNLDAMKAPPSTSGPVVGSIQQLEQTIKALLTVD